MKNILIRPALILVLCLCQGCFVATSKYDEKTRETEILRAALSESKKKNNALLTEVEEINKTVNSLSEKLTTVQGELEIKEKEVVRLKEVVDELQRTYDSTKISRETLIDELLEKEKKYSTQIKELTVTNSKLESDLATLNNTFTGMKNELDLSKNQLEDAQTRNRELERLSSTVHILEGKIQRLQEEISVFLPLPGIRQRGAVELSNTYSSQFISKEITLLFASVPFEAALESNGQNLSEDFTFFLFKLIEICEAEKDCKLDIIASGRSSDASIERLNELKSKELLFLSAFDTFRKSLKEREKIIRKSGRVTVVDKMGKKGLEKVEIDIYLVRELRS